MSTNGPHQETVTGQILADRWAPLPAITAAPKHRETYRFVGFEAEEMADLAADINTWLANNPGWSVKSTQHSCYSVVIDNQQFYGYSALLEVSRS